MSNSDNQAELPLRSSVEVRRSSVLGYRTSSGPLTEVRKFGTEHLPVRNREKFGKPTSGPSVNALVPSRQKFENLLKERSRLEKEIEVYESDLLKALQAEAPYSAAVATAKGCLFRFYPTDHEQECQARAGSTEAILVAHDAYLEARHAWWPFGKPVQELQRALKQTRRELRIVNTEIGI
jgi:hypothetical protein